MTVLPLGSEQRLEFFKVGNDHILSGFYQTSYKPFFFLIEFGNKGKNVDYEKNIRKSTKPVGAMHYLKHIRRKYYIFSFKAMYICVF